ncbi:unnamed protein product [Sphagnum jensenii]|uniref:Uncharacterized protein n=1 Tax=Sphagnum jensenii TaxID=128206 RepID=A0ABP0W3C8_9BRYO
MTTRNSKDHVNTLLSTSLNNPMQIGSQKMGFPFLVVFQLGHNTTNPHILNIQELQTSLEQQKQCLSGAKRNV